MWMVCSYPPPSCVCVQSRSRRIIWKCFQVTFFVFLQWIIRCLLELPEKQAVWQLVSLTILAFIFVSCCKASYWDAERRCSMSETWTVTSRLITTSCWRLYLYLAVGIHFYMVLFVIFSFNIFLSGLKEPWNGKRPALLLTYTSH